MFRKPIFWIGLVLVSALCTFIGLRYFTSAFPIVTVDLRMDREAALAAAAELAAKYGWGPETYAQAASFGVDSEVQNYVELEHGGAEAFGRMLREGLYAPYTWTVRHYKESESNETRIRFTPAGEPYGFAEKLPEQAPGPSLPPDSARTIAERAAAGNWQIDFGAYVLVEQSQENQPGGRTDHTLVYERPDVGIGEATYRLRLVVGGDRLTELTHFVKIPEAFSRKYEEMRSANDTIAIVASIAMVLLYLLGGGAIGLFFLLRERWVIWRKPLFWGSVIGVLEVLNSLNELPLAWMHYDTALTAQGFLLSQIAQAMAQGLLMGILLTVSFMAAESFTRKAFPHHLQLWRIWSPELAASKAVFGRTVAGYLLVSVFFAYEVGLYFFSTNILGWWTPSESLFHPDAIATYFPWLSAIALPMRAGFWEECLFRAVPIAGAALLGQKYGGRRYWIVGALLLQAVIFGAGHANYPAQPAYARLVELIIPSIFFGLLYLRFGLLPSIVLHFAFDVVWFALPIFSASAAGLWLTQALIVLLALVPLGIVLVARLRAGRWREVEDAHRNAAWQPAPLAEKPAAPTPVSRETRMPDAVRRALPLLGFAGLALWFVFAEFENFAPAVRISRSEAARQARQTLAARGITLADNWKTLASVEAPLNQNDRFVWQTGGPELYKTLIGSHLGPPYWRLRFATFEGDVAARAEEYEVHLDGEGNVIRFTHTLPESQPGDSLEETEARAIADSVLRAKFQLDPATLKLVSSEPQQLKARRDWTFTFADTVNYDLPQGEARFAVQIAGSEVTDVYRFVHVPDEWARQERNRTNIPDILATALRIMLVLLMLAGAVGAIVRWSRKKFTVPVFLVLLGTLFALNLANLVNSWPGVEMQFSTAQPYKNQVAIFVLGGLIGIILFAAAIALVAGMVHTWNRESKDGATKAHLLAGAALGALTAGLLAVAAAFAPSMSPPWADYSSAGEYLPLLGEGLGPVAAFFTRATIMLLIFAAATRFTAGWQRRKALMAGLFMLAGLVIAGAASVPSLPAWLAAGVIEGVLLLLAFLFVFRYHLDAVPAAVAVLSILIAVKQGVLQPFPAALPGAIIAMVLVAIVAVYWTNRLAASD